MMIHDTAQTVFVRVAPLILVLHYEDEDEDEDELKINYQSIKNRQHLHDSFVGVPKQQGFYKGNSILKGEIFSAWEHHYDYYHSDKRPLFKCMQVNFSGHVSFQ